MLSTKVAEVVAKYLVVGGGEVVFYLGRHTLKTYVRVRESSCNAMRVRTWAETLLYRSWLHGVTDVISGRSCVRTHMAISMTVTLLRTSSSRSRA